MDYEKAKLIEQLNESIVKSRALALRLFDEATEEDEGSLADAAAYLASTLKYGKKALYVAACGLSGDNC